MSKALAFRVFYRDYVHEAAIPSTAPEPLAADRLAPLAEQVLQHADNFIGVVDPKDVMLQAYLTDDESAVILELIHPESSDCLRIETDFGRAYEIFETLPAEFDADVLPGAARVSPGP